MRHKTSLCITAAIALVMLMAGNQHANAGKLAAVKKSSYWVKNDSTLWTWGRNYDHQLGHTSNSEKTTPTKVYGIDKVAQVITGEDCAFAVKGDGTLWAFGFNGTSGQLGLGAQELSTPTLVLIGDDERVKQLANANYHTLVVTQSCRFYVWGNNDCGQLGVGFETLASISKPRRILETENARMVAAGRNHSLAVTTTNKLYAWGVNNAGQLCDGTTNDVNVPILVATDVKTVVGAGDTTIVIKRDGGMWLNAKCDDTEPLLTNVRAAVVADQVYVITNNDELLVLDGETATKVMDNVKSVTAAGAMAYAIKNDLTLWSLDGNPKRVLSNVSKVATSGEHTLALQKNGTLWAWGMDDQSQLGDGRRRYQSEPVQIATDSLPEPDEIEVEELDEDEMAADVNKDGKVDVGDIMFIINVMATHAHR